MKGPLLRAYRVHYWMLVLNGVLVTFLVSEAITGAVNFNQKKSSRIVKMNEFSEPN